MASPRKKLERVWEFDVSEPKLHPNGFTVYKVICKVFPVTVQENLTEVVIWKRYNDFKLLYKTLSGLHKCLHRREEFPEFAKPKVFGRFDESVIEERRKSALDLLNFVGRHYHLYRSTAFIDFFKGGERIQHQKAEQTGKILRPVKLNLKQSTSSVLPEASGPVTDDEDPDLKTPQNTENGEVGGETLVPSPELALPAQALEDQDELSQTLWNLPQVPDNMSLNSFDGDDDPDLTDVESALSTPLPEADISFFDPLKPESISPGSPPELKRNDSWLISAFKTCADIETTEETPTQDKVDLLQDDSDSGLTFHTGKLDFIKGENSSASSSTDFSSEPQKGLENSDNQHKSDFSEFDPLKSRSHSKVDCGKGDLDLSSRSSSVTSLGTPERKTSKTSSVSSTPSPKRGVRPAAAGSPRRRTPTSESVSDMDLGGQYDYIYIAAHQISRAQESEAAANFEMAHAYYMSGIGILLQGVQGDTNKARREAVKRKTAKYLMKVEDLGKRYMANESLMSPDLEIDPSLAYLKGPPSEMKNFKVLGTVGKVLLVLDRSTDSTYVIKTLHKAVVTPVPKKPNIVPTSCPYMVQFYKFYETDNAVYMLLQYASGGKLWNYIGAYLQYNYGSGVKGNANICDAQGKGNIYMGQKLSTSEPGAEGNGNNNGAIDVNGDTVIDIPDNITFLRDEDSNISDLPVPSEKDSSKDDISLVCDTDGKTNDSKTEVFSDNSGTIQNCCKDRSLSPDMCSSAYVELFSKETPEAILREGSNNGVQFTNLKGPSVERSTRNDIPPNDSFQFSNATDKSYVRNCSLSSDDMTTSDANVSHNTSTSSEKYAQVEKFEETLETSKRSVENFSIGSFDEGDSFQRQDSHTSDHIQSIPEEVEVIINDTVSSMLPRETDTEVFTIDTASSMLPQESQVAVFTNDTASNTHVESKAEPFSKSDISKSPTQNSELSRLDSLTRKSSGNSLEDLDTQSIVKSTKELLKSVEKNLQDDRHLPTSDTKTTEELGTSTIGSATEVSIYDLNRSKESDSLSDNEKSVPGGTQWECPINNTSVLSPGLSRETSPVKTEAAISPSHVVQPNARDRHRSSSGTRKGTSIVHIKSKEPCRSASFECDLKSPSKSRTRTVSAVFEQLDTASAIHSDVVKIPEMCIKQWAAEIVVCLNSLHSMGIVCRDLNPDNILLGDRGHVLLTYFSQWANAEERIEQECIEQLYVAPEVRGITGYNEVCDWWSLGALLYELLVGRSLLSGHPGGITSHTQLYLPSHLSTEASALLEELLRHNPRERLGAGITGVEEIKSHPFFAGIDWASLTG